MAGKSATLAIRIVSDAKGASAGFEQAESRVAGFQRGLDRASVAAGGVLAGVGALAKGAFDAASALQQSTGAIDSVFGDWALDIEQAAQGAAQTVGLATAPYENAASLIGSQLKNMGFSVDENVAKTQELIASGSDLAATFGGTTEEAVAALSSALKGERDPIERYGVSLSQAAIDAKVAALGLDTSTDAAKRAAGAQATLALITEQTASSQGAFAREADTAAGAQARASAEWENAQAALGEILLPVVTAAATKFSELTQWLVANKDTVIPLVGVIAGLAVAILAVNAAITAYRAIAAVATAAQWLWNVAMSANPIGLIVLGVAAVIAAVVLMYNKFEWFRNGVNTIANLVMGYINLWISAISWVVDKLSFVSSAAGTVAGWFSAPATLAVRPELTGGVPSMAGVYGAVDGLAPAPMVYGAPMAALAGGGSAAGQGLRAAPVQPIVIRVEAVDPVAYARKLRAELRGLDAAEGRSVTVEL